jgi:hypothetical protein
VEEPQAEQRAADRPWLLLGIIVAVLFAFSVINWIDRTWVWIGSYVLTLAALSVAWARKGAQNPRKYALLVLLLAALWVSCWSSAGRP